MIAKDAEVLAEEEESSINVATEIHTLCGVEARLLCSVKRRVDRGRDEVLLVARAEAM